MSICDNIFGWIKAVLPDVDVKRSPYEGPRPENGYITYQIISETPEMWAKKRERVRAVDMIDETLSYETSFTVSINAYSPTGSMWISRLIASRQFESAQLALLENGYDISFRDVPQMPRNLTALGTEGYRERWQGDFTLDYTVKHTHQIYELKQIITKGNWDDIEIENKML